MLTNVTDLAVLYAVCVIPWLIFSWYRVQQYTQYFSHEGYDPKRYFRLLSSIDAERVFLWWTFVLPILLPVVSIGAFNLLPRTDPFVPSGAIYLAVLGLTVYFAPRNPHLQSQPIDTQRPKLLLTTSFLTLVPFMLGWVVCWNTYHATLSEISDVPDGKFIIGLLSAFILMCITAGTGPVILLTTRYLPPMAHAINGRISKTDSR